MTELETKVLEKAKELLSSKKVERVLGWTKGQFDYDTSPFTFTEVNQLDNFVYNDFCGANLSKYLIAESKKEGRIAVFLKPCDTYSYNQLLNEKRIKKENVYPVLVQCEGMIDEHKLCDDGTLSVTKVDVNGDDVKVDTIYGSKKLAKDEVLIEKCYSCKGFAKVNDSETVCVSEQFNRSESRFSEVAKLEKMSEKERFLFWQSQLSKCIRCNACRNVCPACSCEKCVFDNVNSGVSAKANSDSFEEQCFHIIRAFHVAGRCTDCGECSRVCPVRIPLHLINRKFIKDADALYGDYQAGELDEARHPLVSYTTDDLDPMTAINKEGVKNV